MRRENMITWAEINMQRESILDKMTLDLCKVIFSRTESEENFMAQELARLENEYYIWLKEYSCVLLAKLGDKSI